MRFMPTGGANEEMCRSIWLEPKIIAAGGSWMVAGDLVKAGKFDEIEELTRRAVALVNA